MIALNNISFMKYKTFQNGINRSIKNAYSHTNSHYHFFLSLSPPLSPHINTIIGKQPIDFIVKPTHLGVLSIRRKKETCLDTLHRCKEQLYN